MSYGCLRGHGMRGVLLVKARLTLPETTATSLTVMKLLSDDARKAATAPISAGSARPAAASTRAFITDAE